MQTDEARIVLGPGGQVEDANDAALALVGVTLGELRALPQGALSTLQPEERTALRDEWEAAGPDVAVGRSNLRRGDGTQVAVRFLLRPLPGARWEALLHALQESVPTTQMFMSVEHVLTAWRAAERRLDQLEPGTEDWDLATSEIARLRSEHQRLFESRARSPEERDPRV